MAAKKKVSAMPPIAVVAPADLVNVVDSAGPTSKKATIAQLLASVPPNTRIIAAGAGMVGGGDLTADRTLDIDPAVLAEIAALAVSSITAGAGLTGGGLVDSNPSVDVAANADGSITVNPNDIQVGVLATDAQHGVRGGGTQHSDVIAAGASGFMTGADKTKLDGIAPLAHPAVLTWGTLAGVATTTTTRYLDPWYNQTAAGTNIVPYAVPSSGKIKNLRITQLAGVGAGIIVYTLLVNGVATALSVSIAATATTGSDLVNVISVAAGDLISFRVTKAVAITTTPTRIVASAELTDS